MSRPLRPGMSRRSLTKPRGSAVWFALFLAALLTFSATAAAGDSCPASADDIATDRPDVTNSSLVVPLRNGVDWTAAHVSTSLAARHTANSLDGTNARLRLGI